MGFVSVIKEVEYLIKFSLAKIIIWIDHLTILDIL